MVRAKNLLSLAGAVCLTVLLSGCVIAPCCGGGYYHHPHYWGP